MSRNSSRRQSPKNESRPAATPSVPTPAAQQRTPNPFGISFVVPTSVVELPSRGSFYSPESTMHGIDSVEIKQMTAKQEEILSNPDFIADGTMLDRLIDSILVDTSINVNDMFASDKNAIVIEARSLSYGNEYIVKALCEACNTEQDFVFDLSKKTIPEHRPIDGAEFNEESGLCEFTLPSTEVQVSIRVLGPSEEKFLSEQKSKAQKLQISNSDTLNFLRSIVVSANGVTDKALLNQLFEVLPVVDIRKIKKVSNSLIPSLETKQEIMCGGCSHVTEREVPFSLGFFWPDV